MIEMTTETPIRPNMTSVIGEKSLKNCVIWAVVLAAKVLGSEMLGI